MESVPRNIDDALDALAERRPDAVSHLMPLVYDRLRGMAARAMAEEAAGHTLQPTALVNELFLKLSVQTRASIQSPEHFLAVSAEAMRRILVDHARTRGRLKRGRDLRVPLPDGDFPDSPAPAAGLDLLALDEALGRLAAQDAAGARVVEMRFFAGMEPAQMALVLGVTERTVRRQWVLAKAWLSRELFPEHGP